MFSGRSAALLKIYYLAKIGRAGIFYEFKLKSLCLAASTKSTAFEMLSGTELNGMLNGWLESVSRQNAVSSFFIVGFVLVEKYCKTRSIASRLLRLSATILVRSCLVLPESMKSSTANT